MKTLLAILLSFIVSEAPVLAIHGGYTLGGATQLMGTYAGVLIPTSDTLLQTGTAATANGLGSNSLGLFTLGIPLTGLGSGTVVIFSEAQQLTGSIQALADPRTTGALIGVITATGQVTTGSFNDFFFGNATETQVTGDASGGLTAAVSQGTVSNSPYGINLSGTANVTVSTASTGTNGNTNTTLTPTESIVFEVDGFLQTYAVTVTGT
jgi:hypothetical protein